MRALGMRRRVHEAKREVVVLVNNRNPKNLKFRVAGKFNSRWGEGIQGHAQSHILTRKLFLYTVKDVFSRWTPGKGLRSVF